MNKYITLLKLSWSNGFVYRTSLFMWRFRQFLSSVMALTVWTVIFADQQQALGYAKEQMLTYIFFVSILQSVVLTTSLHGLSSQIYSGELSNLLLKPLSVFNYLATLEVADKAKNFIFIVFETLILYLIFTPELTFPSLIYGGIFLFFTFGAVLLHFFIQLIFGSIGFFSPDTWGPRFIFFMFVDFTAGKLFPLDILPQIIQRIVYLTPFPYLSFIQIQIFLEKVSLSVIAQQAGVLTFWLVLCGGFAWWSWKKGLYQYSAAGQ